MDDKNKLNNRFAIITYIFLAIFLFMTGYICYYLGFKSETFINNPYNPRINSFSENVIRGDIKSADGEILATTEKNQDGGLTRVYPKGPKYCHVVGFSSNGMSGVELDNNFQLLRSHSFVLDRIKNEFSGEKNQGDTVVTTLDSKVQDAAYSAIGTERGAAIVIEPSTGKILAEVSKPYFDTNSLSSAWADISTSEDSKLLNRVTQGLYPPGSTFKIVTTLSYLKGEKSLSDTYECKGKYTEEDYTIHCAGNRTHGVQDIKTAFANSCNIVFAQMGLNTDIENYKEVTNQLLFDSNLPGAFSNKSKSRFKLKDTDTTAKKMATAFGQGETLVTPYHMALIVSAICNNGVLMEPHLVDHIENDEGIEVSRFRTKKAATLLSEEDAAMMTDLMRAVVTDGTAKRAFPNPKYITYGKTGTAEFNDDKDTHSWFVGFSKSDDKEVAVVVILEDTDAHAYTAASKIFDACFR